ncbi:MAG: hypothetical protein RBT01_09410 [Anaerolineaceae bacterium]|nr:hypothetical protein [Anaerolineaceae bacterium]
MTDGSDDWQRTLKSIIDLVVTDLRTRTYGKDLVIDAFDAGYTVSIVLDGKGSYRKDA